MKKLCFVMLCMCVINAVAQPGENKRAPYEFTKLKENAAGQIENQSATGTCWSFATMSFLESEIIRLGNKPVDLSEMYNVRIAYLKKADSYLRYQGKQQFSAGGLSHDVITVMDEHGIVPESAFVGLPDGKKEYNHSGMDTSLEKIMKEILDKKSIDGSVEWKADVEQILNSSIGVAPSAFQYEGKEYSPSSFRDAMKLKASDYVTLTSFQHHPFYKSFVLELPDNWGKGTYYNLPLDDFQKVMDHAIDNGFTVAWDADVSEKGFSFRNGIGILPDDQVKKDELFTKVAMEKVVTQQNRQEEFDNFKTTDDHLMHITGKAKDQNGTIYYLTKNSWGPDNLYGGYQYVSRNYFQMKTIGIMVHKDAIPREIRNKLGIQ